MKRTLIGVGITAALLAALLAANIVVELLMGDQPFAMLGWDAGGKLVTWTFLVILALGGALGFASDRIRQRTGR